jgi:tripartite-type tricarboxylate transporter receptor subunit TctC
LRPRGHWVYAFLTICQAEFFWPFARPIRQGNKPFGPLVKLQRRQFLHLSGAAAAFAVAAPSAIAQTYPTRPVRIVVGFPAGGTTDIAARLIAEALSERLGHQFIVENRPGAATNLATEAVVRAPADGYTLLAVTATNTINASLYGKLDFNFMRDIAMVAGVLRSPLVLEVHPSVPVKTGPELIAYAKANPGKITMASFGTGTTSHVAGELFKMMSGVNMLHVPYRGSAPMVTDLLGGQVQAALDNLPASIEHIKAGKLRALAVTTAARSDNLPDIPAVGEFLPGFETSAWVTVGAPRNTPASVIEKLNSEINASLADPKMKARVADLGAMVYPGLPADFSRLIAEETEKWAKVVKFAGLKPE